MSWYLSIRILPVPAKKRKGSCGTYRDLQFSLRLTLLESDTGKVRYRSISRFFSKHLLAELFQVHPHNSEPRVFTRISSLFVNFSNSLNVVQTRSQVPVPGCIYLILFRRVLLPSSGRLLPLEKPLSMQSSLPRCVK
jgi:hypothetical protein